jgi:hypothetical protein
MLIGGFDAEIQAEYCTLANSLDDDEKTRRDEHSSMRSSILFTFYPQEIYRDREYELYSKFF